MNELLLLNKEVGETPLVCMNRFRLEHSEYQDVKMTYAGRLDPIASGLLLVLTGDKVHEKDDYLYLPKTYECTTLLGVATDTYDVLGIPKSKNPFDDSVDGGRRSRLREVVTEGLESFLGTFQQAYPPYSSKTVDGKQLHQIARSGDIDKVVLPEREVTVMSISLVEVRGVLGRQITDIISRVTGDFRQEEILSTWNELLDTYPEDLFNLATFTVVVSGGTYIRSIVNSLGEKLGTGACILSLHRTKVGDFNVEKN
jgi:tRNA pseudouridine55 synthase